MSDRNPKFDPATDDSDPVFDAGHEKLPWRKDDALPMDDDGNILPGNDPLDEDPNDNGDQDGADPEDVPDEEGKFLDPNMSKGGPAP